MKILTINNKQEEKFLRTKTADFDFSHNAEQRGTNPDSRAKLATGRSAELCKIIKEMKETMLQASGIGLSANQIGLNIRMFVALVPEKPLKRDEKNKIIMPSPDEAKFYAIFNPEIIKTSKEKSIIEEGCLSVPGIYGEVERPEKITLIGQDKNGKKIKIKSEGLEARVFQHEIDHLNGILFIDRCKKVHAIDNSKS
ncbi:peptide deformylase [Candidatus Wolfebacteria bacterium]|nr:peptide deformylase [Candidatus Wolfebacteria bacterium]